MLDNLPAEILGLVLQHDPVSHLSVRLWKTGNLKLIAKLASGITEVGLRPCKGFDFRLPRVLHNFRNLRVVRLSSEQRFLRDQSLWLSVLQSLPQTIEVLEIAALDAIAAFYDRSKDPLLNSLSFIDIGALLPCLTTLKLKPRSWGTVCDNKLLQALPSTLTSFTLADQDFCLPFVDKLPTTLQDLDIRVRLKSKREHLDEQQLAERFADLARLPASIESVRSLVACDTCELLDDSKLGPWTVKLPQGLLTLDTNDYTSRTTLSFPQLSCLPGSLTSLCTTTLPQELFSSLDSQASLSTISLAWPPTLKMLDFKFDSCKKGLLSLLPRCLEQVLLQMDDITEDSVILLDELPPSLTALGIFSQTKYCIDFEGSFPSRLHTFVFAPGASPKLTYINGRPRLPSSLLNLHLTTFNGLLLLDYFDLEAAENIESLLIDHWPSEQAFPRNLRSLSLHNPALLPASEQELFAALPSTLESLRVTGRLHVGQEPRVITSSTISSLSSLTELDIAHTFNVHSSVLKHLPPTLRKLKLVLDPVVEEDLQFLPPLLHICSLGPNVKFMRYAHAHQWPVFAAKPLLKTEDPQIRELILKRFRELDY